MKKTKSELTKIIQIDQTMISPLGESAASLLSDLFAGSHHIPPRALRRVDWSNPYWIEFVIDAHFATYDASNLTRLVFLAHDYCLRVSIEPAAYRYFRLIFHPRQREGDIFTRHPSLEQAVATWRELHQNPELEQTP